MDKKKMQVGKDENAQQKKEILEVGKTKGEKFSFNSIMGKPVDKVDKVVLNGLKPDMAVINAFKEVVAQNKGKVEKPSIQQQAGEQPSTALSNAIAKRKEFLESQGKPDLQDKKGLGVDGKESSRGLSAGKSEPIEGQGKKKKTEAFDMIEVMPNRSWVTNFYHNYAKAVERADLSGPGKSKKVGELAVASPKEVITPKVESPFQSILFIKPVKHDVQLLKTMKPDFPVISAFKQIISENEAKEINKEKSKEKQQGFILKADDKQKGGGKTVKQPDGAQPANQSFHMGDVPFSKLEKMGVTVDLLKKNGNIDRLLKGEMVPLENLLAKNAKGDQLLYNAAFGLVKKPGGDIGLQMSFSGKQPGQSIPLPDKALGITITPAMKEELYKGKQVPFQKEEGSGKVLSMLVLDALKNMLNVVKPKEQSLKLPTEINGVKINKDQQQLLAEGKPIRLSGMAAKDGTRYDATVQVNSEKKTLSFSSAIPSSMVKIAPDLKDKQKVDELKGLKRETSKRDAEEVSERKGKGMKM